MQVGQGLVADVLRPMILLSATPLDFGIVPKFCLQAVASFAESSTKVSLSASDASRCEIMPAPVTYFNRVVLDKSGKPQ